MPELKKSKFAKELESLINRNSIENESDTPDFILADYLNRCLSAYNAAVMQRDKWFNVNMRNDNDKNKKSING